MARGVWEDGIALTKGEELRGLYLCSQMRFSTAPLNERPDWRLSALQG